MYKLPMNDADWFSLIPPDFGTGLPEEDANGVLLDIDHLLQCSDASETVELIIQEGQQETTDLLCGSPDECSRGKRRIPTSMPLKSKRTRRIKGGVDGLAQSALNTNQSRKRQQEERLFLRIQVQELAELLNRLLLEGRLCTAERDSSHPSQANDVDSMETQLQLALRKSALQQILSMKRAALQQQEKVIKATVENMRLQALISECNQVVSSMEEEIRQHWSATPMDRSVVLLHTVDRVATGSYFGGLGRELDVQYQHLDSIRKACGLASIRREEDIDDYQIKHGASGPFLEYVYSRMIPFAHAAAARVSWQCINRGVVTQTNGELKVHKSLGEIIFASMVDSFQVRQRDCDLGTNIVMKRFIESDRVVIVWDSVVEISSSLSDSSRLIEKGWVSFERTPCANKHARDTQIEAPCTLQTCSRTTAVNQELAAGAFAIEAIQLHRRNMLVLLQIVENILMDEMLGIAPSCHTSDATSQILLSPCTNVC